ncbi:hypothetical protein ACFVHW_07855 [Streptomyces sp. NPDC127110]|uniref:hypothetical protein n=1 Tax=Streptomyces sp. NPDC127110 TaxID=3345362 RepID=UPI003625655B
MFFFSLPSRARTALVVLVAVPALGIVVLDPEQTGPEATAPLGVVITNQFGQVTVRTADGQLYTVTSQPAKVRQCDPGRTFPACTR